MVALCSGFSVTICILLISYSLADTMGTDKSTSNRIKYKDDGKWKKKDIRDYSDADVEKLYDQWEDNDDEELPADELPPYERTPPPIDMSKLDLSDRESVLRTTKKGRMMMLFATVAGTPNEAETERLTARWQTSLFNAHIEIKRYVLEPGKVLLALDDGAQAIEVKDFLVKQDSCLDVTIDGQVFDGKGKLKKGGKSMGEGDGKKRKKKTEL